ncbi:MAG TPA: hypothetical protein VEA81_02280 [Burkholderiaceae bacterium]|nr:hypothetical protein [Burkholderiaceae bacterium]
MNGGQDLGGQHGFGPVVPEPDEPWFHEDWERRAFALTVAMGATGAWNIDQSRAARESLPPAEYLTSGYYRIWFEGLCALLRERGLVDDAELAAGRDFLSSKDGRGGDVLNGGPDEDGCVSDAADRRLSC